MVPFSNSYVPAAQSYRLHGMLPSASPTHSFRSSSSAIVMSQVLDLVFTPASPHEVEHPDQAVHSFHSGVTNGYYKTY